jgi:hypothetical protein
MPVELWHPGGCRPVTVAERWRAAASGCVMRSHIHLPTER